MYAELHVTLRPDEFAKYYTLAAAEAHFYWLRCIRLPGGTAAAAA